MKHRVGFIFPGQGSQSVGMLSELAQHFSCVQETFAEASKILGYDLWALTQSGPAERLNQTEVTQPALLAAGVAVWRAWREKQVQDPHVLAGHSLGEYTALVCAEALSFSDAISLVAARGRYMQEAVPEGTGAMAAVIGLTDDQVKALCSEVAQNQEVLEAANFNADGQVVIAGHREAVERAVIQAKAMKARMAVLLPVSVPSHCALMKPAAEKLAEHLEKISFQYPRWAVIHNVDVATHTSAADLREALVQQLYRPVRWVETVHAFSKQSVEQLLELGPGKVLAGLNKRITPAIPTWPVFDQASYAQAQQACATVAIVEEK